MKELQELFCFEKFRPILTCYFADREIYRYLMASGVSKKKKMLYLKKIHVFERAFIRRVFDKIN